MYITEINNFLKVIYIYIYIYIYISRVCMTQLHSKEFVLQKYDFI